MDPSESANIQQYIQLFGHPPPGITPQNMQLVQALQAAKMAAPSTPPPKRISGTPGMSGAVKDAIAAVAAATAPQSITQRQQALAAQEAASQ